MCGMLSMRHKGASISELTGRYLGKGMLQVMRVFSVILLVMCGVVFTTGPAGLLAMLTPENLNATFWLWVVMAYYLIATFVPIDAVIGKLYPVFGVCLSGPLCLYQLPVVQSPDSMPPRVRSLPVPCPVSVRHAPVFTE